MSRLLTLFSFSLLITACTTAPAPTPIDADANPVSSNTETIAASIINIPEPLIQDTLEIIDEIVIDPETEPLPTPEETEAYIAEQTVAQEVQLETELIVAEQVEEMRQLAAGGFIEIDRGHGASGDIRVFEMEDEIILEFQSNFVVIPGPDLYVYISRDQTFGPKSRNGADLNKMKLISALASADGTQMYKISKSDWENYGHSVVIWCKAYGYLFSHATF